MDKMRMESVDMTAQNIEKIGALFPNCITEMKDENSKMRKAVNFELLKQMLSGEVLDGDEAYEFTWVGKKAAIVEANKPIRKTLRPCVEKSVDWDTTENLYIEGDNLEVLKLLQESYLGKVKIIYIDPPYNTGSDAFIYPDDYSMDFDEYYDEAGIYDEDGNKVIKENNKSNPRFHSKWCSMIYQRLLLARNILSDDGFIFISIDENEVDNLKKICDEIFGADNFINNVSINMNSLSGVKMTHAISGKRYPAQKEYLLLYRKSANNTPLVIEKLPKGKWDKEYNIIIPELKKGEFEEFQQLTDEEVNLRLANMHLVSVSQYVSENNIDITDNWLWDNAYRIFGSKSNRPLATRNKDMMFSQKILCYTNNDGNKRFFRTDYNREARDPRIELVQAEANSSVFLSDNWVDISNDGGAAQEGGVVFPNGKKPLSLIKRIIKAGNCKNGDIVLDFFSGSATTAHAVIALNSEDQISRKFIMVQYPETCDENSVAYKDGFKTICDLGRQRIKNSAKKVKVDVPDASIDTGFRVFKVDDSNMRNVYYSAGEYEQSLLDMLESNVKEDRTDLDLLFGCLLEWGLPLSMPYTSETIDGFTVHTYNDGDLIACFDENITDDVVKVIAKRQPLRAVFRDSSFNGSPAKINVGEIFKLLAPDTRVKVI